MDPKQTAGIIIERDGKVLLMRRALTKKWEPGKWNFGGGCIEPGETPIQAAIRECHEEAGVLIDAAQMVTIGIVEYEEFGRPAHFHLFAASLGPGAQITLNAESMAYGWFTVEEALALPLIQGEDDSIRQYKSWLSRREASSGAKRNL